MPAAGSASKLHGVSEISKLLQDSLTQYLAPGSQVTNHTDYGEKVSHVATCVIQICCKFCQQ